MPSQKEISDWGNFVQPLILSVWKTLELGSAVLVRCRFYPVCGFDWHPL